MLFSMTSATTLTNLFMCPNSRFISIISLSGKMGRLQRKFNLPRGKNSMKYKRRQLSEPVTVPVTQKQRTVHKKGRLPKCKRPLAFQTYNPSGNRGLKLILRKSAPPVLNMHGYRIINLELLASEVGDISLHAATCPDAQELGALDKPPIKLLGEGKNDGLACFLHARCVGCGKRFTLPTSPRMESSTGSNRFEINVRAVWGQMATGGVGHISMKLLVPWVFQECALPHSVKQRMKFGFGGRTSYSVSSRKMVQRRESWL